MRIRRGAGVAAVVAAALVLAGCTTPPSQVVAGSSIAVGWDEPFTSYNAGTSYGRTTANANVVYATNSGFTYYDNDGTLVDDSSFGSYQKLSDDPLVVRYTIADGVRWSDGTAIDAADLLLDWVANSGAYNTPDVDPSTFVDPTTGQFTDAFPKDIVYFDSGADPAHPSGLGLVTTLPEISDDRKSITLTYDSPSAEWQTAFFSMTSPGLAAHVVAKHALGLKDAEQAKEAMVAAISDRDDAALAKISHFWDTGFNFTDMPEDADLVVSSGPYTISDFVDGQYVTLTANHNYAGSRQPHFEKVTLRFIADPLQAVQALMVGEVKAISPQPSVAVLAALKTVPMTVVGGYQDAYEHLDLQFDQSKNNLFQNPLVREAFLKVIPRQEIVTELVVPLRKDATTRDSQLFLPGAEGYEASVKQNGSAGFDAVDVEGATALLAQAGVSNPEVCVLYDPANALRVKEFELIQASAALAGFVVTDCSDPNWKNVLGAAGKYDAALYATHQVGTGLARDVATFTSTGSDNLNYYANDTVDTLLGTLGGEFDLKARLQIQQKVDAQLWSDFYGVPLFQYPAITAFDKTAVTGIAPSALPPTLFWNIWAWSPVIDQ